MWNNLHKPLDSGGVDMKSFKILICTYNCKSFKQGLNSWTFIQENILKLPDLLSLLCRSAHEDSNKICFIFFRGSYYLFMNCGSLIESFKIKQIGRKIEKPATGPIQPTGWHHAGCAACLGGRWASLETNKRSVPMAAGYTGERRQRKKKIGNFRATQLFAAQNRGGGHRGGAAWLPASWWRRLRCPAQRPEEKERRCLPGVEDGAALWLVARTRGRRWSDRARAR
jgi:hypothetical protein